MKSLYTIGETAKLLGVTTQTLRYYDKIGLLPPCSIDESTGYRYYAFRQFHYIDRIKYLQRFGLPLDQIKEIMINGKVDMLLTFLEAQKEKSKEEMKFFEKRIKDLEWYIDYFTYLDKNRNLDYLYKIRLDTRYIITAPCYRSDELSEMEFRLAAVKSRPDLVNLNYRRQYGYRIDFDAFLNKKFQPDTYFVYLRDKPSFEIDCFQELPQGEYLCYGGRILTDDWNPSIIADYYANKEKPSLVLAMEFEENLVEYQDAWYEVQIWLE